MWPRYVFQTTTVFPPSVPACCQQEVCVMSKSESIDVNKEIVRRFVTAIPVTDPDETEVRATMAEDAVWEFPLAGDYKPELKAFTGPTRWNREEMIAMQL